VFELSGTRLLFWICSGYSSDEIDADEGRWPEKVCNHVPILSRLGSGRPLRSGPCPAHVLVWRLQ
jgi:hypothetical protein